MAKDGNGKKDTFNGNPSKSIGKQSKISYPTGLGWTRSNTSTIGPGPEHDVFTTLVGTVEGCALLYQVLLGLFIVIYYSYSVCPVLAIVQL